jgi:hypothetical protein
MRARPLRWRRTALLVTTLATMTAGPRAVHGQPEPAPRDGGAQEEGQADPPNEDGAPLLSAAFGHGFTVASGDGRFEMAVRGRAQVRNTLGIEEGRVDNDLAVRTVRLHWEGHTFTPHLTYEVQLALGPDELDGDTPSPVFDAFFEYDRHPRTILRVGQFFVPFDRARMMREWALQFVERQQVVTELGLDRDVGVVLWSTDVLGTGGHLGYHVGVFGGSGRNRLGPRGGVMPAARLVVRPLGAFDDEEREGDLDRNPRPRLGIGLAGAYSVGADRARATTGDRFQQRTARYLHGAADVQLKVHGFSLLAEVIVRQGSQDMQVAVIDGEPIEEWTRDGWGYLIQVGAMVTDRLELVARWEALDTLGETDPDLVALVAEVGREAGVGCNVYFNGHRLKLQADYLLRFGDAVADARHEMRLALDVTF